MDDKDDVINIYIVPLGKATTSTRIRGIIGTMWMPINISSYQSTATVMIDTFQIPWRVRMGLMELGYMS